MQRFKNKPWVTPLLLSLAIFFSLPSWAQNSEQKTSSSITLWNRNFDTAPVDKILALALEKTEDLYGPTTIVRSKAMEYEEAIASLKEDTGSLTLLSAASSIFNDKTFLTIRFPVLKGLLGSRVCLIRKGDSKRFDKLVTIHDFSVNDIKVCQVGGWPDTEILRRNGLPLLETTSYLDNFDQLANKQCDCFLRGAQEIYDEYISRTEDLDIEPGLVIEYAEPGFIYLNSNYGELATRIELGLLRALDDGSYDKLFDKIMSPKISTLHLNERRRIQLANPAPSTINTEIQKIDRLWLN